MQANTNHFSINNSMTDNITYFMLLSINTLLIWFKFLLGFSISLENINIVAGSLTIFFLVLRNARFCIALMFDIYHFFKMSSIEKKEKIKSWLETEPKDK